MGQREYFEPVMKPLSYHPAEIEHAMYMFDHRCVGCVVFSCKEAIDRERMGRVYLEEKELIGNFFFSFQGSNMPQVTLFAVKVRGNVGYGGNYRLSFEGFYTQEGELLPPMCLVLTSPEKTRETIAYESHDRVALQAAREGMVLLKNECGTLPFPAGSELNLFGSGVANFRIGAIGAGKVNPRFSLSLAEAVKRMRRIRVNEELLEYYRIPNDSVPPREVLLRAKEQQDTAVLIISRGTGENVDNQPVPGEYYLTGQEETLLGALRENFSKLVVILNTGYPIGMEWMENFSVDAVLYAGLSGQSAAIAVCEILTGEVCPSGRLTDSWAWRYEDIPSSVNFYCPGSGEKPLLADDRVWVTTCYEEGIYVGYRYFESFQKPVAFSFGHGLSYTDFDRKCGSLAKSDSGKYQLPVSVTNTGNCPGKDAVLLFASFPGKAVEQPARQLIAFEKTGNLAPGETQTMRMSFGKKELSYYDEKRNGWYMEAGEYVLFLGGSVQEARECGRFILEAEMCVQTLAWRLPSPVPFTELSQGQKPWPESVHSMVYPEASSLPFAESRLIHGNRKWETLPVYDGPVIRWPQVVESPELLEKFVAQMGEAELARMLVMYCENWGMEKRGEAGRLAPTEKYDLPDYACADGNCGLNLPKPNIGMPTSVMVCASFNRQLAYEVGKVIGEEAVENRIRMVLATAMNIHRNPLNGRHPEYFSEDPYLTGKMAAAQIRGLHSAGIADSIKHVACNNCESARKRNHSLVGERALREIYLRAYEYLLEEEAPDTIMTGYNALNGSMCAENEVLIEGIFREDLGFDGFAMTDWNSYDTADMVTAVNAGISWLTPGEKEGGRVDALVQACKEGRLSREIMERNVYRIFKVMLRREGKRVGKA